MPSLNSLPLSLSEILEANGGPLRELEIWALLCQCAEALQDIIIKGEAVGDEAFRHIVTPNSLLIRDNGTIFLTEVASNLSGSLYMAPELESNSRQFVSDTAFEKMFVYSMGRTLQVASEFGLTENEVLSISYDLNSLLQAMSERNAAIRLGLMHILEACALQASQHPHKPPHIYTLSRLYQTVLSTSARSSFRDSSYGSGGSRQSTIQAFPGRARRPRPHVRHRRENQKSRSRSRSRSRSYSPIRNRGDQDSGFVTSSQQSSTPPQNAEAMGIRMMGVDRSSKTSEIASTLPTTVTSSQFLNTSLNSTESDHSEFGARYFQALPYAAVQSVQGILGLRQGSPAYQKYIQLKERQIRLRQARLGQTQSVLNDVRSHLMTPTLLSHELLDNMSENRSMASLMSYTLGTYKPDLHAQFGSSAAVSFSKDTEDDTGSQLSLMLRSGECSDALRAEPAVHHLPESNIEPDPHKLQQQQHEKQTRQQQTSVMQPQHLLSARPLDSTSAITTGPVQKHKEYYGPEFVFKNRRPAIKITMPLPGDNVKNAALMRKLTIVHLTGQKLEIVLDPSTTGQHLVDTVFPYLDLDDLFLFGLTYMSEGEHFFLDADTKLHKVAPEGWKDGPKGQAFQTIFTLYIRIKFYPDSLTDFRHTSSYHLLYLQLRRDVLEERVTCDSDTLARLAGLAMQAENGDHNQVINEENIFVPEHYFPSRAVRRLGASVVENNVTREHKNCSGIPDSQAEIEFIKHVRHLPDYGIHFHKLFKTKSNTDTFTWVGLSKYSLVLAEPEPFGRTIIQDYPWNSMLKISFNKRRFSIQPKMEMNRGKPPKISFYTSSYRKGRYLLQFSTDLHRFQIRMRTRPSNMETLSGDSSGEMKTQTVDAGVGDDDIGEDAGEELVPSPAYVDPTYQMLPADIFDGEDNSLWEGNPSTNTKYPLRYRNPPPYQPHRIAQILGNMHVFSEVDAVQLHASTDDLAGSELDDHQLQMLLDMSSWPPSQDSALTSDKYEYEEQSSPHRSSLFPANDSKLGRCIFEVTLEKENTHGIGLTIVGGETTGSLDLGIFVKSVVPGGPAERDGRIMPGDRLIAIGGISLEGKQHREAVAMIRDGGPKITLLVSQIRPPGTIKKRSLHDEQAEFEKKLRNSMLDYNSRIDQDPLFLKSNISDLETLLRYDDFVNNVHSNSDSDNVYNSDEKNYTLEPSSAPSSSSQTFSQSASFPGGASRPANYSTENQHTPAKITKSSTQHKVNTSHAPEQEESHDDIAYSNSQQPETIEINVRPSDIVQNYYKHSDRDTNALQQLREEQEIVYECDRQILHWSSDGVKQNRKNLSLEGLTEDDRSHLQLLGDIAALEADDSSSDSDFDAAIKKTIEGADHRIAAGSQAVNAVSPMVVRMPAERDAGVHDLTSVVIYEVILESRDSSLGIITNTPSDSAFPKDGVYVKEILPFSSAEQGGILAIGDRIMEVAGQSVLGNDSKTVQTLLNSSSGLVTVKVSRSLHRDAVVTGKSVIGNENNNNLVLHTTYIPNWNLSSHQSNSHDKDHHHHSQNSDGGSGNIRNSEHRPSSFKNQPQAMSISKLITSPPKGRTQPLDECIPIAPPPPPLALISQDSESNTQSDMDSDILDSSRSELENIFKTDHKLVSEESGVILKLAPEKVGEMHLTALSNEDVATDGEVSDNVAVKRNDNVRLERDIISIDDSSEFNEQLLSMKSALDKLVGSETVSPSSISHSSDSSPYIDSVIRSPKKFTEEWQKSLVRQTRLESEDETQNENDSHDDDDDVVVTLYGNEPATVSDTRQTEATSSTSASPSRITSEDVSVATVKDTSMLPENQASRPKHKLSEPEVLEVFVKKDGIGFGFTVAGGVSTGGCYIKQLISESAVANGQLRPGDKILKVSGQDVTSLGHIEAVSLLRKIPDVAHLQILRPTSSKEVQVESDLAQVSDSQKVRGKDLITSLDVLNEVKSSKSHIKQGHIGDQGVRKETSSLLTDGKSRNASFSESADKTCWLLRIELLKPNTPPVGLGLSVEQREMDGQTGIFVKSLKTGGVAHKDGRLKKGDRIIQANGVSFIGITKSAALSALREADERVMLTVTRSDVQVEDGVNVDEETERRDIYLSPRMEEVDVPVIMSKEWLRELPVMQEPRGRDGEFMSLLLQSLTDLVQAGEHREEFRNLHQMKATGSCHVARLPGNKSKNRYRNVLPYDDNRVKLLKHTSDYINANHICMKIGGTDLRYIACQGPTPETISDFWTMVWQEKISVIVMLTQVVEAGKVKCHTYWPQTKDAVVTTHDEVLLISMIRSYQLEDFTVVQMHIQERDTKIIREITQIQYTSWPDHGAPETALPLLKLLQVVHLLEKGSPSIIHCSAGIGRTGTFIAVDAALATIEQGLELDMHQIVRTLRTQRYGMVQTTDQYLFCYTACMEALLTLITA